MNEPNHDSTDHQFDHDLVASLKTLKPRAPRLEWNAIRVAELVEEATTHPPNSGPLRFPATARFAVAWWSGMAVGGAITFFAMQWFVLHDLRNKVERLQQATNETVKPTTGNPWYNDRTMYNDRTIAGTESAFDINLLLDAPNLSVGSCRGLSEQLVYTRRFATGAETSFSAGLDPTPGTPIEPSAVTEAAESEPGERATNRLRLQQDLQREIY